MPPPKNSLLTFISGIIFCTLFSTALRLPADVLVYKDGDRVSGTLIRKDGGYLIFSSNRFGELIVPETDVTLETAAPAPPATPLSVAQTSPAPAAAPASAIAAALVSAATAIAPSSPNAPILPKHWWHHWHGRLATSVGIDSDLTERSIFALDGKLLRTWTRDEVQLNANYNHNKDTGIVTVDLFKASGRYSHTFGEKWFSEYRATFERDPITSKASQLHQQIGFGRFLYKAEKRTVRLGVAENLFNTWPMNGGESTHVSVESIFVEASFAFPWRITITERGVLYFTFDNETNKGWENDFEISKKLTDSFSVAFRYEVRFNNPDPRVTDYQRTRFLLGYDF